MLENIQPNLGGDRSVLFSLSVSVPVSLTLLTGSVRCFAVQVGVGSVVV